MYSSGSVNSSEPPGVVIQGISGHMFYLCRRGRENLRHMRREDFVLKTDSHDRRFYMNIPKYEWEKKSSGVGDDDFSSRR